MAVELLQRIQADVAELRRDYRDMRDRAASHEGSGAAMRGDQARLAAGMDRIERRLDRAPAGWGPRRGRHAAPARVTAGSPLRACRLGAAQAMAMRPGQLAWSARAELSAPPSCRAAGTRPVAGAALLARSGARRGR